MLKQAFGCDFLGHKETPRSADFDWLWDSGRPSTCKIPENVAVVRNVFQEDRPHIYNIVDLSYVTYQRMMSRRTEHEMDYCREVFIIKNFLTKYKITVVPHPQVSLVST